MNDEYLFVYGSLMKSVGHSSHEILDSEAELVGRAWFRGRLYMVRNYPGVVGSFDPSERVKGELYRLKNAARVFPVLDRYEGHDPENRDQSLYLREKRSVELLETGDILESWIYIYNRPTGDLKQIDSGNYLSYIKGTF